jgi:hypothetical protein
MISSVAMTYLLSVWVASTDVATSGFVEDSDVMNPAWVQASDVLRPEV